MSSRKAQARTVGASYKTKLLIRRNAKQARAMLDLNELLLAGGRVSFISTNTRKHIIQCIAARGDDEEWLAKGKPQMWQETADSDHKRLLAYTPLVKSSMQDVKAECAAEVKRLRLVASKASAVSK